RSSFPVRRPKHLEVQMLLSRLCSTHHHRRQTTRSKRKRGRRQRRGRRKPKKQLNGLL
ncbi:hypothetical protein LTR04_007292, partial [Oleoguttula sp. CCFEE 6159]